MANQKTKYSPARRFAQNVRTFLRVQKRRKKHADNHGLKVSDLGAKRWITEPTQKK